MDAMKTIRWGMIGCGDVTEVKSGPAFQKAEGSSLVACMRRNAGLAEDYARRHQIPRWYADADSLINDPEVDAVYIATPPSSHCQYAIACAQAGKPVYVEKPMAVTFAQCQDMIAACRSGGVPLFVAYYRRSLPRFLKIKEFIDSGAIGQVRAVSVLLSQPPAPDELDPLNRSWRVIPEIAGGGRFVDMACHTLDFLDFALGPIREASGSASRLAALYPAEDTVCATFVFESGIHGSGCWCFASSVTTDWTEIIGSSGKIGFASFENRPIQVTDSSGTGFVEIGHPEHIQQSFIQTIVDELNGRGTCPCKGETGARTTWIIDQILARYRTHELEKRRHEGN